MQNLTFAGKCCFPWCFNFVFLQNEVTWTCQSVFSNHSPVRYNWLCCYSHFIGDEKLSELKGLPASPSDKWPRIAWVCLCHRSATLWMMWLKSSSSMKELHANSLESVTSLKWEGMCLTVTVHILWVAKCNARQSQWQLPSRCRVSSSNKRFPRLEGLNPQDPKLRLFFCCRDKPAEDAGSLFISPM